MRILLQFDSLFSVFPLLLDDPGEVSKAISVFVVSAFFRCYAFHNDFLLLPNKERSWVFSLCKDLLLLLGLTDRLIVLWCNFLSLRMRYFGEPEKNVLLV